MCEFFNVLIFLKNHRSNLFGITHFSNYKICTSQTNRFGWETGPVIVDLYGRICEGCFSISQEQKEKNEVKYDFERVVE
jgi:hypothetical protein